MEKNEILAIEGGNPVHKGKPIVETDIIEENEIDAVVRVLKSKKVRRAELTEEYEKALADYYGVKHAIAVANGTVSLHIAMAAMGIGPGDEVIVTPITFIASDTCVLEQNAIPIFADIDPDTLTIDPEDIARKITDRTKAIIPVSLTGMPMDMDPIMDLAKKHNLYVLEDNAQAPGALYKGRKLGTIGHVSSYSTVTGKIIATGEGGYLLTNDDDLYERMWGYHDFARIRALGKASKFHYGMPCTNYRITNMQAALGLEQLERLDEINKKRKANAKFLDEGLRDCPGIRIFEEPEWSDRVYFYYVVRLDLETLGAEMIDFAKALGEEGVYDFKYYTTTRMMLAQHLEPLFLEKKGYGNTQCPFNCPLYGRQVEYKYGQLPFAEQAERDVLWLSSVHPLMSRDDLANTVKAVRKVATAFIARKEAGLSNSYATDEERSLCWDPYYLKKGL